MDLSQEISLPAKRRRRHPPQFRAQVLAETREPGVSVAAVARRHGLNANLIHKWRREVRDSATPAFIALPAATPVLPSSPRDVRIELPGAKGTIQLHWPCEQHASLAELLKALR